MSILVTLLLLQKICINILPVYRKHNQNILSSFLQLPKLFQHHTNNSKLTSRQRVGKNETVSVLTDFEAPVGIYKLLLIIISDKCSNAWYFF